MSESITNISSKQGLIAGYLDHARKKRDEKEYDDALAAVNRVLSLLDDEEKSVRDQYTAYCMEIMGDVEIALKNYDEALNKYEQCVTIYNKLNKSIAPESMQVLFKMERTLNCLTVQDLGGDSSEYKRRWTANVLLEAQDRIEHDHGAGKSLSHLETGELSKLWQQKVAEPKIKEEKPFLQNEMLEKILRRIADVAWRATPFISILLFLVLIAVQFQALRHAEVVREAAKVASAIGSAQTHTYYTSENSASTGPAKDTTGVIPSKKMDRKTLNCVNVLKGIQVSIPADLPDKLQIVAGKQKRLLDVYIQDGSAMSWIGVWMQGIFRRNLWFRATDYGLQDKYGNFYFQANTPECYLANQIVSVANKGGKDLGRYVNPFASKSESIRVITLSGNLDGEVEALRKHTSKLANELKAGSIFCLKDASDKTGNTKIFCAIDRKKNLIPFTFKAGMKPLPQINPEGFSGAILLSGENADSAFATYGGIVSCIVIAFLAGAGAIFATNRELKAGAAVVAITCTVLSIVGMFNS